MKLKTLTRSHVKITVTAEIDETPVRGNAMASDDKAFDKACEDEIFRRLDSGDVWAWAYVTVKVSYYTGAGPAFSAETSLGCCSYESEADFRQPGGYYDDMVSQAIDTLNQEMQETWDALPKSEES